MRLSTSTNIHEIYGDNLYYYTIEESIKECAQAGFRVLDINLHTASLAGGPLDREDWEAWVDSIEQLTCSLGVELSQAHAHFYTWPVEEGRLEWHEEMMRRSILAAGRLGVSWLVVHPFSLEDEAWYSRRKSMETNLYYMKKYEALAAPFAGLGLAVENMVESREKHRFGSSAEDLLELYEALDSERFGLCWDFGHAERSKADQRASLLQMGKSLKATHVEDTNGMYFGCDHLLPFAGMVKWEEVIDTLAEIGYEGDLTFEIHNFTRNMPPALRTAAVRFCYEVGCYLVKRAHGPYILQEDKK